LDPAPAPYKAFVDQRLLRAGQGATTTLKVLPEKADRKSAKRLHRPCLAAKPPDRRKSQHTHHVHGKKRQKKGILTMVEEGKKAPHFELKDADGKSTRLWGLEGHPLVLYFYPKDDTSGCTAEAKDFTCLIDDFKRAGAEVIGVSPDSPESHRKFREKYALGVRLLADEAREAAEAYGVWVEKSMYGRKYMGVERSTFLIDKAGKVARIWRSVRVPGHAEEVLESVRALKS
jgi:thioredoxin-dependent peroxiredoxin